MDHTQSRGATAPQMKVSGTATERDHEFHVATRYVPHDNSAKNTLKTDRNVGVKNIVKETTT